MLPGALARDLPPVDIPLLSPRFLSHVQRNIDIFKFQISNDFKMWFPPLGFGPFWAVFFCHDVHPSFRPGNTHTFLMILVSAPEIHYIIVFCQYFIGFITKYYDFRIHDCQ